MRRAVVLILAAAFVLAAPGCLARRLAIRGLGNAFATSGEILASDDDPDLVRDAAPFALKAMEGLIAEAPRNRELLLGACRGFTQYAFAFLEVESERVAPTDRRMATELKERALRMYLRARGYGLRFLETGHPGITVELSRDPQSAVAEIREVDGLYWVAASWGGAISLALDRPELVADLSAVQAMSDRALALDEAYAGGALHDMRIGLEALPASLGGSFERARFHFERAVELSAGQRASPYVTWAVKVDIARQDRAEFERMLHDALAVDPDAAAGHRLENRVMQRRARDLLDRQDEFFLDEPEGGTWSGG